MRDMPPQDFDHPKYGTYDNAPFYSMPRPVAPYPSIGYPALGYKPHEASFDHESVTNPYRMRHTNGPGPGHEEDNFVWQA